MQSTYFFDDALARLKRQLDAAEDQQVADALGLSKAAFSARKKRDSFPEKELRALAQQRPELGIDVDYVLTGTTEAESLRQRDALHAAAGVSEAQRQANMAEVALLSDFRACPPDVQAALRTVLAFCSARTGGEQMHKADIKMTNKGKGSVQVGQQLSGASISIKHR